MSYKSWFSYISIRPLHGEVSITWHDKRDTIKMMDIATIGLDGI